MIEKLIQIANEEYDGHFTLLKFTRDYGCCFGTLDETLLSSSLMSHSTTIEETIRKCIDNRTNSGDIARMKSNKMITITDINGNSSILFPEDEVKIVMKNGKERFGEYLGECTKYREHGHWYFTLDSHDPESYCDYADKRGSNKYLTIYENKKAKTSSIDESNINNIIVVKHCGKKLSK